MGADTQSANDARRNSVRELCRKYLPETENRNDILHWGQIGFDHIAKNYGEKSGTTCGFLPHWLLWRLGCRDATLVNRTSPIDGLRWHISQNLSLFQTIGKKVVPSWVPVRTEDDTMKLMDKKIGPKCGDFIIIRGGKWKNKTTGVRDLDSAHIMVLLDVQQAAERKVVWRIAQTGLSTDAFKQGGAIQTLTGRLSDDPVDDGNDTPHDGPNLVFTSDILDESPNFKSRVIGYTNLDAIGFGAAPDPTFTKLFDDRITERANNNANQIMEWMGWWELGMAGGFIALAPTYLRLERGHEVSRLERTPTGVYVCRARGVWTRTGSKLEIEWNDAANTCQSWQITSAFVPHKSTTGVGLSTGAGPLNKLKDPPANVPPNWLLS